VLSWVERDGHAGLRVDGVAGLERLAVLPSELVGVEVGGQPVAGRFERDRQGAVFLPRFAFMPGTRYTLLIDGAAAASILRPPRAAGTPTRLVAIHPTAAVVPVNLLRIYVRFSAPMSEGWAARAVRMVDGATGASLPDAFLGADDELWDRSRRRLTLLLDPGRIKRGLAPHQQTGYPLVEGRTVAIVVDASFPDADGQPLAQGASRRYRVGPPVRARVTPGGWTLRRPAAGSSDPLVVELDRPLDHALLEHGIGVLDADLAPVPGRSAPGSGERSWRFEPDGAWGAGPHRLRVAARLEDLAGNSVRRVFDRDLARPGDDPLGLEHVDVGFEVPSSLRASARPG